MPESSSQPESLCQMMAQVEDFKPALMHGSQHTHLPTQPHKLLTLVVESCMLQLTAPDSDESDSESDSGEPHIFKVFANEKKKRKASKLPEAKPPKEEAAPPPPVLPPAADSPKSTPQYRYQSGAEDQHLVDELLSFLMGGKLTLTTPVHIFAASLAIRKEIVERLCIRRVEAGALEEVSEAQATCATSSLPSLPSATVSPGPKASLPLQEINVFVNNGPTIPGVIDPGSQVVVIHQDLAQEVRAHINHERHMQMEGANGTSNWTVGFAENLPVHVGDIAFQIHAHVVQHAPFRLLLGRPFLNFLLCRLEELPEGNLDVSICDPRDQLQRIHVPSRPRVVQVGSLKILAFTSSTAQPRHMLPPSIVYSSATALAYKKVARKIWPVPATLPEDFRNVC